MQIRKADGSTQNFSEKKLISNLQFLQIPDEIIHQTVEEFKTYIQARQEEITHTKDLTNIVGKLLAAKDKGILWRSRYMLKDAIYKLGPSGYNFERYVGKLFENKGFSTEVGIELQGSCVSHEVDVYARKENEFHYVECKFHNKEGTKSDITTVLYSHARFRDLHNNHEDEENHTDFGWLATNTKLTTQALEYAKCVNMQVLSLTLPADTCITKRVIFDAGMLPITVIPELQTWHDQLIADGFVVLKDILPTNIPGGVDKEVWIKASRQAEEIMRL